MFNIDSAQIDKAVKRLKKLNKKTFVSILVAIGSRVGLKGEELISVYPDDVKRTRRKVYTRQGADGKTYLSAFKNMKQQGLVWWLIQQHRIPYVRTGLLGRSLNSVSYFEGNTLVVKWGTNVIYAPYVIGDENEQALIHQNYWTPLKKDIETNLPKLTAFAESEFGNALSAYITEDAPGA